MNLSTRPITTADIEPIVHYWTSRSDEAMTLMGVDLSKRPQGEPIRQMLHQQIATPLHEKKSYAIIWLVDGEAVGHCNVNNITVGARANMHLHLWDTPNRKRGIGTKLVRETIDYFFKELELQALYCEPYAHNPAPNKTLPKAGFTLKKTYLTVPGSWSFEQETNQWYMSREMWAAL